LFFFQSFWKERSRRGPEREKNSNVAQHSSFFFKDFGKSALEEDQNEKKKLKCCATFWIPVVDTYIKFYTFSSLQYEARLNAPYSASGFFYRKIGVGSGY
jgi:hypothetical protein